MVTFVVSPSNGECKGSPIFLCLDNWDPEGPLYLKYGHWVVLPCWKLLECKVASFIHNTTWVWPHVRSDELKFESRLHEVDFVQEVSWLPSKTGENKPTAETWEAFGKSFCLLTGEKLFIFQKPSQNLLFYAGWP